MPESVQKRKGLYTARSVYHDALASFQATPDTTSSLSIDGGLYKGQSTASSVSSFPPFPLPHYTTCTVDMTEFESPFGPLPHIPDDVTLPQFLLDSTHPRRPIRKEGIPWLIEDATGRRIGFEEVRLDSSPAPVSNILMELPRNRFALV